MHSRVWKTGVFAQLSWRGHIRSRAGLLRASHSNTAWCLLVALLIGMPIIMAGSTQSIVAPTSEAEAYTDVSDIAEGDKDDDGDADVISMGSDCSLLWSGPDSTSDASNYDFVDPNDEHRLIDLHDFRYLLEPPKCDDQVQALIVIHSAPQNNENRWFIRQTWGSTLNDTPIRLVFLLADARDELFQEVIRFEHMLTNDIVQGSFVDAYRNLTYKHVMGLKWFHGNCADAQVMIKVDDDHMVNTPLLLKYLYSAMRKSSIAPVEPYDAAIHVDSHGKLIQFEASEYLFQHPRNLIFCYEYDCNPVMRDRKNKWYVSESEFVGDFYPGHCSGYSMVYSADVVARLYKSAQRLPYFWIDDVHVSGIVRSTTDTRISDFGKYMTKSMADILKDTGSIGGGAIPEFLFVVWGGSKSDRYLLWQICQAQSYVKPNFTQL